MKLFQLANLVSSSPFPKVEANKTTVQDILEIAFVIIGALAFLMLVIAGFRYIIYGSDPSKLSEVKRQIAYALVGLIIVAMAATIVNFVLDRVG